MKTLKTALVSLSLAGLMMAQSAQAATRSSESLPSLGVQAAERVGSPLGATQQLANDDDDDDGGLIIMILGGAAGVIAFLEAIGVTNIIGYGDSDNDSPG